MDDHNVLTEDHRGYLDTDTESLYNIGQAATGHAEAMTRHEPKGMTWYEKTPSSRCRGNRDDEALPAQQVDRYRGGPWVLRALPVQLQQ